MSMIGLRDEAENGILRGSISDGGPLNYFFEQYTHV